MVQERNGNAAGRAGKAHAAEEGHRPLTARSVLASTLLGADPPELPVAQLVHVAGLFGINENRARVALSRMAGSGEVGTDGAGRYRLAGHLLERQQRQALSRAGRTRRWTGRWVMVVAAGPGGPEERARRRRELALARMGELRQGVWLRPDNLFVPEPGPRGEALSPAGLERFVARPEEDGKELSARLWDLEGWATRASRLIGELSQLPPKGPDELAPGFVLSAAVLRHFQADPLLPDELLPERWPGAELRRRYEDWDRSYRRVLAAWSRTR